MKNIEKLPLINGTFHQDEVRDLLQNIYTFNINYHKLKNFATQIRFERSDENTKKSLNELEKNLLKIQEILIEAKTLNKSLLIKSEINISFCEES